MREVGDRTLSARRSRHARVAKIKNAIIAVMALWMIISIAATAILTYKIFSLQEQINILSQSIPQDVDTSESNGGPTFSGANVYVGDHETYTSEDNTYIEGDVRKVYLTFDDGPSENTDKVLDVLDDYGIKATFFVNGRTDEESIARYKRIVDEGHTIGMHSYSHKYSEIYESVDGFEKDYKKILNLIYDETGVECKYYRFPGGSSNKVSNTDMREFTEFLEEEGVTYFDWNVSSGDATSQAFTSQELVDNIMSDVLKYKSSIVLMHDGIGKDVTADALPEIIESLQQSGAILLPIDDSTMQVSHIALD